MKKRFALFIVLVLIVPMLAACGGGGDEISADDAEAAFRAVFEGNIEEANKYVCDEQKVDASEVEVPEIPEGVTLDVSCEKSGENMDCTMKLTMPGVDEPMEQTMSIAMKDGKLCDPELSGN